MALSNANLALEGGDPRRPSIFDDAAPTKVDNSVSFEEYLFWAKLSRANDRYEDPNHDYVVGGKVLKKSRHPPATQQVPSVPQELIGNMKGGSEQADSYNEKAVSPIDPAHGRASISSEEWVQASRAIRTASWGAVFYLITTDILGPFGLPWAFAAMGYGPGVVLFSIFGFFAAYGGFLLWRMFLALDSDRHPLRTYGDIAHRVYGRYFRHFVNLLQSIQLLLKVGIIIVNNGISLEQIVTGSGSYVCFIILCFIWAICGMLLGQIRTLRSVGWLAHAAIWMNVFIIIMTMATVPGSGVQANAAIAANAQFHITTGDPVRTSGKSPNALPMPSNYATDALP